MVAPYTWILSLLILSPLQTVDGFLEEVDKKCEGRIECALHSECESYKEAVKQMKTLPEQSCQRKEARQNLKGRVCNKVFQMSHYLIIIILSDKRQRKEFAVPLVLLDKSALLKKLHRGDKEGLRPSEQDGLL